MIESQLKSVMRANLGELYPVYEEWSAIKNNKGVQMKMPYVIQIH